MVARRIEGRPSCAHLAMHTAAAVVLLGVSGAGAAYVAAPTAGRSASVAPANEAENGRHISMSNVHGTFFKEPEKRWFETHNATVGTSPAHDFKQRLYPLNKAQYSPWEPTVADMTPTRRRTELPRRMLKKIEVLTAARQVRLFKVHSCC